MDAILEKLGVYDALAVLLTGFCITFSFAHLAERLFGFSVPFGVALKSVDFSVAFSVALLSYFVGMVFQEISNLLEKAMYRLAVGKFKTGAVSCLVMRLIPSVDRILMTEHDMAEYKAKRLRLKKRKHDLCDQEIAELRVKAGAAGLPVCAAPGDDCDMLYGFCKVKVAAAGRMGSCDKDLSIGSMARSLSLYSALMIVMTAARIIRQPIQENKLMLLFVAMLAFAVLSLVFMRRWKRFIEKRQLYILRTFLYGA